MRLSLLFILWSLIEIGLFVTVGGWLGLWISLAVVIGTAILGVILLRGGGAMLLAQARVGQRGQSGVGQALVSGVLRAVAAILLIMPGFLTDFLGLLLLLPPVQWMVSAYAATWILQRQTAVRTARAGAAGVIEGNWSELPPAPPHDGKGSGWTRH